MRHLLRHMSLVISVGALCAGSAGAQLIYYSKPLTTTYSPAPTYSASAPTTSVTTVYSPAPTYSASAPTVSVNTVYSPAPTYSANPPTVESTATLEQTTSEFANYLDYNAGDIALDPDVLAEIIIRNAEERRRIARRNLILD